MGQTKLLNEKAGSIHDLRMGTASSLTVSPLSTTFNEKKVRLDLHVTFKAGDQKELMNESNSHRQLEKNVRDVPVSRGRAESLK